MKRLGDLVAEDSNQFGPGTDLLISVMAVLLVMIFISGHASQLDDPLARDKSESARIERNWEYAGRRAGLIARLVQEHLTADQKERIVVVSAGEMDMRVPRQPDSPDNAWVEVVFGKQWKLP